MTIDDVRFPGRLWHYTNTQGMLAIVADKVIWATDAEYLNDAQELRYAREHVSREFRSARERIAAQAQRPATDDPDANVALILSSALGAVEDFDPSSASHTHVFVACFCEEGDLLSQWRGYAAGSGFALGFDAACLAGAKLKALPKAELPVTMRGLRRVSYGDSELVQRVDQIMKGIIGRPTSHPGTLGDHIGRDEILPMLAEFKHPAFAEEREWRLVATDRYGATVPFRSGPLGPTPYVAFDFGDALVEVKVGPGPHQALRQKAIRRLVGDGVDVTLSEAPFRG